MSIELTQLITDQIDKKRIKRQYIFKINGTDRTSYVLSYNIFSNIDFGSMSAVFVLKNPNGIFSDGGTYQIDVGDVIELIEKFSGDTLEFSKFYGIPNKRNITVSKDNRTITLTCLDYISILANWNIDLVVEGTRVKVEDEILTPTYLDEPNENMAQLFNFANDSIATDPISTVKIKDKTHDFVDPQFDGFEIYYDVGQLKLGCPLQVKDNYDLMATYYYYTIGKEAEDILEEILIQEDGYGKYLFGETSAQDVIDNHLTTTFNAEEGINTDTLIPNLISTEVTITHQLTEVVEAGDTSITLDSIEGLPESGQGEINGDIFTWSTKGSGNTLTGIPATGEYSLSAHSSGSYMKFEETYLAGQIWYLSYSNLLTVLTTSDFTLPEGVTVEYHHLRGNQNGSFIILSETISVSEVVTCNTNYSFKTLQATGIEINKMTFREVEVANALEAINKLRDYVAPNYIIRTEGDKIWASYLQQKTTEDYELELIQDAEYMEDEDLYTRVILHGKTENPTNIMFEDTVEFTEEEQTYTGIATKEEMYFIGEEKSGILSEGAQSNFENTDFLFSDDTIAMIEFLRKEYIDKEYIGQTPTGYHIYTTPMTNRGKIILDEVTPFLYINNIPIDNKVHQITAMPIKIKVRTETIASGNSKSKDVSVATYYYYTLIFPHTSIVPSEPIYLYDAQGILVYTITPNNSDMDYANGTGVVPGNEQNSLVESFSTATYWINYSTDKVIIDYDNIVFKIHKSILPNPTESVVRATFEYWNTIIPIKNIDNVVDGRRDTQIQLEFFGEPPSGFVFGVIDLGEVKRIQAIDIIAGYFKPDEYRKYDMSCNLTLQYSLDGVDYSAISDKTDNFALRTGDKVTFEEDELGTVFEARYIKIILQSANRIEYGRGIYVVAIAEVAMYDNIILRAEAKLISTTQLTANVNPSDNIINVVSTAGFTASESGEEVTAYMGEYSFTYTGLTSISFTGCVIESGGSGIEGDRVSQTLETDSTLYDDDGLLPKLGDRVYKEMKISDRNLYSQSELDRLAKSFLKEFYKKHTKKRVNILFAPYLKIGQTVKLVDNTNNVNENYFIEGIDNNNGFYSLVLARYPL